MKKVISLFSVLTISVCSFAQHEGHNHAKEDVKPTLASVNPKVVAPTTETKTAVVAVETLKTKELEFDFGKIPQGKPVTHVFEVTNSGTTPFKLDNVQASCGCTTPVWNKEESIAPGKSSIITVGYNAAAEGPFTKPVTITYNGNQTKMLTIKGEVWKTPESSAPVVEKIEGLK